MTREQIEKAAMFSCTSKDEVLTDFGRNCFIEGAQWRINAVWHDARTEVPDRFKIVLIMRNDENEFSLCKIYAQMIFCPEVWVRWAYLDDLLPERKEETK